MYSLVDTLRRIQPRHLGDGYCLQCLCRRCVCEPPQEGKVSADDELEVALAELRKQMNPEHEILRLFFTYVSDYA